MTMAAALALAGCAQVDDTTGSRLTQPPPNSTPRQPIQADDIAIVGQDVAHSIMDLPAISGATVPPMVQFSGVTSIITPPIDTEPYTELFRDRLLLLTREKLRFQERTLPMLSTTKKKHKETAAPQPSDEVEYQVLAEMRGRADDDTYKIQVQFVDAHTNEVLFDGLYRIRKEDDTELAPPPIENQPPPAPPASGVPPDMSNPPAPTAPTL